MSAQAKLNFANSQIREAEDIYRKTGNPLWVWKAVAICCGTLEHLDGVNVDLPQWVLPYLGEVSRDLVAIGHLRNPTTMPHRDRYEDQSKFYQALIDWKNENKLTIEKANGLVLHALKFVSGSSNRIKEFSNSLKNMHMAFLALFEEERESIEKEALRDHGIDKAAVATRIRKGRKLRPHLDPKSQG